MLSKAVRVLQETTGTGPTFCVAHKLCADLMHDDLATVLTETTWENVSTVADLSKLTPAIRAVTDIGKALDGNTPADLTTLLQQKVSLVHQKAPRGPRRLPWRAPPTLRLPSP